MGIKFEKIVDVSRSYNKLDAGGGVSTCNVRFLLKGPKGAVQFLIGTDWAIKSVREHLARFPSIQDKGKPEGWDVGYHSYTPMYEDQSTMGPCEYLDGKDCYYDGSGLRADDWMEDFLAGGTDWLWPKMEEEYNMRFEGKNND